MPIAPEPNAGHAGSRSLLHVATLLAGGILGASLGPGSTFAHAFPAREMPRPGAVLAAAPPRVVIMFTEDVNARFSGITVRTSSGARVDNGDPVRDRRDHKVLSVGFRQPLAPGTYVVRWHALAMDGHRTQGHYDFAVSR
ncbi:MAG: copper resistance protein CopC [Rhodospirillales bacterium]|nr:copper resistance protein CopC [Rhodospirillales bacterium]